MNRSFALLTALALLGGCQALSPSAPDGTPPVEEASPAAASEPKVYASFDKETLFALLTAELAGQRNRFDIALGNYVIRRGVNEYKHKQYDNYSQQKRI